MDEANALARSVKNDEKRLMLETYMRERFNVDASKEVTRELRVQLSIAEENLDEAVKENETLKKHRDKVSKVVLK